MDLLKFDGEFTPSFYWEFSVEINKECIDNTDKEIIDIIEKLNFCVEKVTIKKDSLNVKYLLPIVNNKTFITKGFTQFLTTGLIKSITIDIFNQQHEKLFTILAIPHTLKCPNWCMNLETSDNEILALDINYEIESLKII